MKNKVKFLGVVILVLITLFCFGTVSCNNDDDGNGTPGNGTPGNGTPGNGGPINPPGPGLQTLSGSVQITPSNPIIGDELVAFYTGSENVALQWTGPGGTVLLSGSSPLRYTPVSAGSYTATATLQGYNPKSSTIPVSTPPPQPQGGLSIMQSNLIDFGNRMFYAVPRHSSNYTHNDMPYALPLHVKNDSAVTIPLITFELGQGAASPYNIDSWNYTSTQELTYNKSVTVSNLAPGQSAWIAIQPELVASGDTIGTNVGVLDAFFHYDIVKIIYAGAETQVVNLNFHLEQAEGVEVPDVEIATLNSFGKDYITINSNGKSFGTPTTDRNDQEKEYAISRTPILSNPPPSNLIWIKNGQTLDLKETDITKAIGGTKMTASEGYSGTDLDDEVTFTGLIANTTYYIYTRYAAGTNHKAWRNGSYKYVDGVLAPLAVRTALDI